MILNPYQRHIILTKAFKKTLILKQTFKLAYILLFSECACHDSGSWIEVKTQRAEGNLPVRCKTTFWLPQMTRVSTSFKKSTKKSWTISGENLEENIFAQLTPVEPRGTFDLTARESLECVSRNLNLQFARTNEHTPLLLPRILNFNFGFTAMQP